GGVAFVEDHASGRKVARVGDEGEHLAVAADLRHAGAPPCVLWRKKTSGPLELGDVGEILRAAGRALVRDQLGAAEKGYLEASHPGRDPSRPGATEIDSRDVREHVDAAGREADLDDRVRPGEVGLRDSERGDRGPEADERFPDACRVLRVAVDPDVEVAGGA